MTRIKVPSETHVVEMGEDGLNIIETFMQMSEVDDSDHVKCDICSKPLGKMKDVKHIESPETITIAVRNGFLLTFSMNEEYSLNHAIRIPIIQPPQPLSRKFGKRFPRHLPQVKIKAAY